MQAFGVEDKLLEKFLIAGRYTPDGTHITAPADDGDGIYQVLLMGPRTAAITRTEKIPPRIS